MNVKVVFFQEVCTRYPDKPQIMVSARRKQTKILCNKDMFFVRSFVCFWEYAAILTFPVHLGTLSALFMTSTFVFPLYTFTGDASWCM